MDDAFLGHHKTKRALRAGPEALWMWCALRTYVALNLSDGEVPDEDIDDLPNAPKNPRRWLTVLVECGKPTPEGGRGPGLVDPIPGAWRLHDFDIHGESKEQVEKRRAANRERQKRLREQRESRTNNGPPVSGKHRVSNTGSNAVTNGGSNDTPSHPIPSQDLPDTNTQGPDRSERETSGNGGDSGGKIPCPADLELLPAQRTQLEMNLGIQDWAIDQLTVQFRVGWLGQPDKEMLLESWRSYLSGAIVKTWSDPQRRPKRQATDASGNSVIDLDAMGIGA